MPFSISVLDLVGMRPGESAGQAMARSVQLAQLAEGFGFRRFWLAEHHNTEGQACAATAVLVAHVADKTSSLRVGSGGIMLPNHAPLVIAEQFGTLVSLFPGRIDLGLGRAPGCDPHTAQALRRPVNGHDQFEEMVDEIRAYLDAPAPGRRVRALPGENTHVPITLLGSSDFTARLAAKLGLPFAFGSHFAPEDMELAIGLYRDNFQPSSALKAPYVMAGVPIVVADTESHANYVFTTVQQRFLALHRRHSLEVSPPVASMDNLWNRWEKHAVDAHLGIALVGTKECVREGMQRLVDQFGLDEILAVTDLYNVPDRLRSYTLLAEVAREIRPHGKGENSGRGTSLLAQASSPLVTANVRMA